MIFKYRRAWGGLVWGPGIICWNPAGEPEVQLLSSCAEHRASLPLTPPATPSSPLCLSLSQNTPQDPLYPFRGLFALLWMSLSFPVLFSFSWISNHLSKSLLHFCEVSPQRLCPYLLPWKSTSFSSVRERRRCLSPAPLRSCISFPHGSHQQTCWSCPWEAGVPWTRTTRPLTPLPHGLNHA